jgi:ATP-binding cassette subfamily B protein
MSLLWQYLKNYKSILAGALVLATINQVFSLIDPQIFRLIVDKYASRVGEIPHDDFLRGVILLLLASMGTAFVSRVAKNFQDYYVNVIVQRLGARMYNHSVDHSFSLPYAVFEDQRSGEFLNKLQKARDDSQKLIQSAINSIFLALVGIILVLGYAFYVHWLVGLVYFLIIPALGGATYLISKKIKNAQQRIIKQTSALAGSTTETLRNVELVKSLGLEQQEIKRLNQVNEQILGLELEKVRLVRKLSFLQGTLINALRSALMLLMLWLIFTNAITLGEFFSLLFYSFAIFQPLGELGNVAATYQETKASMERLDEILKTPKEEKPANAVQVDKVANITFDHVHFTYGSAAEAALADVNFQIAAGKTVAFVGPSGSGKTTIIKLIVGLYPPTSGRITVNGTETLQLDAAYYRNRIGFVSQDTQLFAGTIRDNLLFVKPDATDAEATAALKSASALSIIERGGLGLETKIGEGGLKLSGGEKQRLSIARALLRNPDLIIFDEATSALDSLTEEEITRTIKDIKAERPNLITVLIAHRLSTIIHADTIFVLEKGKIAEFGNHQQLLEQHGLYAALWRQQIAARE